MLHFNVGALCNKSLPSTIIESFTVLTAIYGLDLVSKLTIKAHNIL